MVFIGGGGNQNIIQLDERKGQAIEGSVHHPLDGVGSVTHSKRHDQPLEKPEGGDNCRLANVIRVHGHLVIAFHQINFRKKLFTMQICRKSIFDRSRKLIS